MLNNSDLCCQKTATTDRICIILVPITNYTVCSNAKHILDDVNFLCRKLEKVSLFHVFLDSQGRFPPWTAFQIISVYFCLFSFHDFRHWAFFQETFLLKNYNRKTWSCWSKSSGDQGLLISWSPISQFRLQFGATQTQSCWQLRWAGDPVSASTENLSHTDTRNHLTYLCFYPTAWAERVWIEFNRVDLVHTPDKWCQPQIHENTFYVSA